MEEARTEFVAFLDADCEAPKRWLEELLAGFAFHEERFGGVAAVGGPALPPAGESPFYDSVSCMTSVFLGHLNSPQARPPCADREVEHLPGGNLLVRREAVLAAGNFSADFSFVCEDVELGLRLRARGARLVMLHAPVVLHRFGVGLAEWTDRMFRFGLGQMLVARVFPRHLGIRLALPLVFLVAYTAALLGAFLNAQLLWLPFLYFMALGTGAAAVARRRGRGELWGTVFLLFLATHFAYALGEAVGLVRYLLPELEKILFSSLNWLRPAGKKAIHK